MPALGESCFFLSRGILCNWLVCCCLAVFIHRAPDQAAIPAPILTFVALGYEHSVANMYFLPAGIIAQGYFSTEKLALGIFSKPLTGYWEILEESSGKPFLLDYSGKVGEVSENCIEWQALFNQNKFWNE